MNRDEIRYEIATKISEFNWERDNPEGLAEDILQFLEDIGFDTESSLAERQGWLPMYIEHKNAFGDEHNENCPLCGINPQPTVYSTSDPNASWSLPK